jgi:site-specific recombinase XerD
MRSKPSKPRGRPPRYVVGEDGKPIVGLSLSSQGRYYATHSKPRATFGRDFHEALAKFRAWQAAKDGEPYAAIKVNLPLPPVQLPPELEPDHFVKQLNAGRPFEELVEELGGRFQLLPQDATYAWARTELLKNPARFAERVGIPSIGYLQDLPKPDPPAKLSDCIKEYERKRRKPSADEMRKVRQAWRLFESCVKPAKNLQDVTTTEFNRWIDRVFLEYEDGDGSPKTVHHRLKRVFTVLNYCKTSGIDQRNCDRLVLAIRAVELPDLNHEDPNPISRDEFHGLLAAAKGTMWESMLMVMLNLCYYPIDIRTLTTNAVNLDTGVVIFQRAKKNTTRVGILWERTRTVLRQWMGSNVTTEYVYLSNYGTPFTAQGLRHSFRRLRDKSGLGPEVTMDRIRDGAYTAAIQGTESEKQAKIIAGHRFSGETDAYVKRHPHMVIDACRAIEKFYFD